MSQFRAVAFDLFDTLVDFDPELFPLVEINGKGERTTSRVAYDALYKEGYSLPNYLAFHMLWLENSREVWKERERAPDYREVSSRERFLRLMGRLVAVPEEEKEKAAELTREAHMAALTGTVRFCRGHLETLERIREAGLPIGLVSNFDHAPAARSLLERAGISPFLKVVVISQEVGFRKPNPCLFRRASEGLGARPAEVLFVGDDFSADVVGAQNSGMPCAWLNPEEKEPPEGARPPDYEIRRLRDTLSILGLEGC